MSDKLKIKIVQNNEELLKAFMVRGLVFIGEQNITYSLEFDGEDYSATHVLGIMDTEPIAAARIRFIGEYAKLERICVRNKFRGNGFGKAIIQFLISHVESLGYSTVKIHAQTVLEQFYANLGFRPVGDIFEEAGLDHRLMIKDLG